MLGLPAHRVNSVTTGDGAAAGMLAGLHGLRVCRDLVQCLTLEAVEHPASLSPITDQPGVLQHLEMKRESRLGDAEHLLELADAALLMRQHFDDLDAGFIREGMKPAGDLRGIGPGGGWHALNVSTIVDTSSTAGITGQMPPATGAPVAAWDRTRPRGDPARSFPAPRS